MDCRKLALTMAGVMLALYGCDNGGGGSDAGGGDDGGVTVPPGSALFPARDMHCAPGDDTPPCHTTVPALTAAQRVHPEPMDMSNATMTFVVNTLSIPEATSDGVAAGFNLDGLDSGMGSDAPDATCEEIQPDFTSGTDPNQVGVDNALQGLVSALSAIAGNLDDTLAMQIASGSVLLMIEVTGIDSLTYDSAVQIQLFRGSVTGGSGDACTTDTDCTTAGETCHGTACQPAPMIGSDGLLAADQTFGTIQNLGDPVPGDIFAGRLRAVTPGLSLSITASGQTIELMVRNPEVRFNIAADGLTEGNIGGVLKVDDLAMAAGMIDMSYSSLVHSYADGIADINPTADDPATCDSLSVGILFGATTAMRNPM